MFSLIYFNLFLSLFLFLFLPPLLTELVNVQLLRHLSDHRVRREAGVSSMPDVIVTQFRLSDNDVILRLRRVSYPRTYTFGDVIEEHTQSPTVSDFKSHVITSAREHRRKQ